MESAGRPSALARSRGGMSTAAQITARINRTTYVNTPRPAFVLGDRNGSLRPRGGPLLLRRDGAVNPGVGPLLAKVSRPTGRRSNVQVSDLGRASPHPGFAASFLPEGGL